MISARGLKVIVFYSLNSVNEWLASHPDYLISSINYAHNADSVGSKERILISYKETEE